MRIGRFAQAGLRARNVSMRVAAVLFAVVAVVCLIVAVAGMATGRMDARRGTAIRVVALVSFAIAVVLNVVSR